MKLTIRKILFGGVLIGLGVTVVALSIKTSRQSEEIETLRESLTNLNKLCDDKNMTIGKILTEIRTTKSKNK